MRPEIEKFLTEAGLAEAEHSGATLFNHLKQTCAIAMERTEDTDLHDACALHSVYGTEFYRTGKIVSRLSVRAVVSERAERLAWLFCSMVRSSLNSSKDAVILRDGTSAVLRNTENSDLLFMLSCNSDELNSRGNVNRTPLPPPSEHGFFMDLSGDVHLNLHLIDVRIIPRRGSPLIHTRQILSEEEGHVLGQKVLRLRDDNLLNASRVFLPDGSGTRAGSNRTSMNFTPDSDFDNAFSRMEQVVTEVASSFRNVAHPPVCSGTQGLYYSENGRFEPHSDSTVRINGVYTTNTPERQLVSILYLCDGVSEITRETDCIGGELHFPKVRRSDGTPYSFKPKSGMLVVFPANLWYLHGVTPVRAGNRMAVSKWWRVALDQERQ